MIGLSLSTSCLFSSCVNEIHWLPQAFTAYPSNTRPRTVPTAVSTCWPSRYFLPKVKSGRNVNLSRPSATSQHEMTAWFHSISTSSFCITLLFDKYRWESVVKQLNVITNYVLKVPRRQNSIKFRASRSSAGQNHATFLSLPHDYQETESVSATSVAAASPRFYSVTNYLHFPIKANFYLFIYLGSSK